MYTVFKVLGEEHRYQILGYLAKHGSSCVCDLEVLLDMKQANLSKHLKVMRDQGLLSHESVGKNVHYFVNDDFYKEHKELVQLIIRDTPFEKIGATCIKGGCK